MDRIRFESENYFFYLNKLILKDEYRSKSKIIELVDYLNNMFNFRVTDITYIDNFSGIPEKYYTFDNSVALPNDKDSETLFTCRFVYRGDSFKYSYDYENIVGDTKNANSDYNKMIRELTDLYNKFFTCSSYQKFEEIEFHKYGGRAPDKYKKKRKIGKQWGLSHQDAYGSKIEELLGEELKKLNINFKIQQQIFGGSKLMTVPDFYIEEIKLVIYCDGFQYHYDKDTVIKDRQQDRRLQYMGYKVLRFTGSEIVGDVRKCADEIRFFIQKFKEK